MTVKAESELAHFTPDALRKEAGIFLLAAEINRGMLVRIDVADDTLGAALETNERRAAMLRQAADDRGRIDKALAYLGGWQKAGETPFDVGCHVAAILNGKTA